MCGSIASGGTFVVSNTRDSGAGSLREAINQANDNAGLDGIEFNIPGTGPHTIQPTTGLPEITDTVIIDGFTQPGASPNTNLPGLGSNALLMIELDGSGAGVASGLVITGANCKIKGLVVNRFALVGIGIAGTGASGNLVQGNFIGTDVTGSADLGNVLDGVQIQDAPNNTIGGAQPGEGNILSGNGDDGIFINGTGASGNVVRGNFIGTDVTGSADLENALFGVQIKDAPNNIIGGSQAGAGNVISGNDEDGIFVVNPGASGNVVQGNLIGTDVTGRADLGNGGNGVIIQDASNNTVGGSRAGDGNVIAFNDFSGVTVGSSLEDTSVSNSIRRNAIYSNGALGIDLGDDGVSASDSLDADTGPNNLQNFPAITSALATESTTRIVGSLKSFPNEEYTLDFYANNESDDSNFGEGERYLDSVTVITDRLGDASFDVTFAEEPISGELITATATDSLGSTSEFSEVILLSEGGTTTAFSFESAVELGEGCRFSEWFGSFNMNFIPWIFHSEHSWMFVSPESTSTSVFLYDLEVNGWLFTEPTSYPSMYSFGRNAWIFYFVGTSGPRQFVDLDSGEFFSVP